MNKEQKKLLILAGAGPHCKVVEAANEMGIYTIVADYLKDSPAKLISDECLINSITDIDGLVAYCKENNVDGVLGFCMDPTSKPAQQIAEKCGLPVFGTGEQVFALTNKKAFKNLCVRNGVDIIPEYKEQDITTGNIEYPVLVKPVDSRGSRGCIVCNSLNELLEAIPAAKAESSDKSIIIERYMSNNQDLTISYVVKNGEPTLVSIGDRYPGKEEDNLNRQLSCTIQPSRYAKMYTDNVDENVKKMIKDLGIQNGLVFMQGFVDNDTVRMYDPGIRFPGNEYERIVEKATGINLMKSIISYVVGGEIDDYNGKLEGLYDINNKCAIQYIINVGEGKIAKFEGLEEISQHPNVVDVQQRHFVGATIETTGDVRHRAGEISILVERNIDSMIEMIEFVQSKLKIEDANNRNMIISPISSDMISKIYSSVDY